LHIELVHALHVEKLPRHHRDPFDRLLIAQSMIEKIAIVSSDEKFDSYGIVRLWK
jgi:PIN domain nuclease of toxin-antitoxin system